MITERSSSNGESNGNGKRPDTIIDGDTDREIIERGTRLYVEELFKFVYGDKVDYSAIGRNNLPGNIRELAPYFKENLDKAYREICDIIEGINRRAQERRSDEFTNLLNRDTQLWNPDNESIGFGVFACVDKGIPFEAVCGVDGQIGRTLGGDLDIEYIPSLKDFCLVPSALSKKLIHSGRSGLKSLVEPIIEHTGCGRRAQVMGNEFVDNGIPSEGFIFANIFALRKTLPNDPMLDKQLKDVQKLWESYTRSGQGIQTPDQGLYAGIISKMAQRQAIYGLEEIKTISPIEIYNKLNGDLIVGVDNPQILSDNRVIAAGGFTSDVVNELSKDGSIFSFRYYDNEISSVLSSIGELSQKGSYNYDDLQKNWVAVQGALVDVVEQLWNLYKNNSDSPVRQMVDTYLEKALYHLRDKSVNDISKNRLIHHMFHSYAYSYVLDTFGKGNVPGEHIESYLATGDHDTGAKPMTPLGQGDLARPSAYEMFTQYVVLQHSKGLQEGMPVIATIKQDTDRSGDQAISTEESTVALEDLKEFLKLWPYFMVGDLIPVSVIRGKEKGGVSRIGLSILLSLHNMQYLLESKRLDLPVFVPANSPSGEVVMVPAVDILEAGIEASGDLHNFRKNVQQVALRYINADVQDKLK